MACQCERQRGHPDALSPQKVAQTGISFRFLRGGGSNQLERVLIRHLRCRRLRSSLTGPLSLVTRGSFFRFRWEFGFTLGDGGCARFRCCCVGWLSEFGIGMVAGLRSNQFMIPRCDR